LLKLFGKSFTKNFYDFRMLSGLTLQAASEAIQVFAKLLSGSLERHCLFETRQCRETSIISDQ
ncbi:hypothetical protein, partial [Novacetimonas hansenii]|uniref:hypothetical protein n=1 Tax=Novacetimonas hansenii TaxID=436 RepID=UPI002231F9E0